MIICIFEFSPIVLYISLCLISLSHHTLVDTPFSPCASKTCLKVSSAERAFSGLLKTGSPEWLSLSSCLDRHWRDAMSEMESLSLSLMLEADLEKMIHTVNIFRIFPLISTESYVVIIRWNRLDETIPANGHSMDQLRNKKVRIYKSLNRTEYLYR